MLIVATFGSLLLLSVTLVRPGRRTNVWLFAAIVVVTPFVLTQVAATISGRFGGIFPEANSELLFRDARTRLQAVADDPPDYVILIEGASWTSRGFDGGLLESRLEEMGYPAAIIQVSLPAGNHFERDYILANLSDSLMPQQLENLAATEVILMREVARPYDWNPANQISKNLYTDRVYAYMAPARAYEFMRASASKDRLTPILFLKVLEHAAFNWLRVGEAQRFETPHNEAAIGGYRPLDTTDERPPVEALDEIVEFIDSDEVPSYREPEWVTILTGLGSGTFGFPVDRTIYFETPTWKVENNRYARWFASQRDDPAILIDDPALYRALAEPELWFNVGHLRREGAEIYTEWMTERVLRILATTP